MSLPRFSITGTYDLKKTLSYLGVSRIFQEHGDLTRIVPNRSLKVGEVSCLPSRSPQPSGRISQPTPPPHGQAGLGPRPALSKCSGNRDPPASCCGL